eukprot:CAMPEP_0178712754 /NCGR_PEP_ID=MMETSP0699-20121125/19053_1 /TAXON_ID=265572 /ORGANISM="Extubocellulus spinifer, Strain CCMP396" /LENGTH=485 /DNA_ID=CAMNT_0020361531 /DNA_START=11 /DNA_END=1468 /DNA_ORIENTATION=-
MSSYQQGGGSYAPVPGLSDGAIPLHYANASDGDGPHGDQENGEYGEASSSGGNGDSSSQYRYQPPPGGYGNVGGSGGGIGGVFDYIRSSRPLSLGIGFFLLMLFLLGGGGGSSETAAPGSSTTTTSSVVSTPSIGDESTTGGTASSNSDGGETSRFSGGGGVGVKNYEGNSDNSNGNSNTNNPAVSPGGEIPRGITWLAYFPLSGAYYVSLVVKSLSVPTGTNYNSARSQETRRPVFDKSPQGPFQRGTFSGTNEGDGTVLVSTHCGGTCPLTVASFTSHHICQPSEFIETIVSFDEACRTTYYWNSEDRRDERGLYDPQYVERMIHLVRDPMANVVSMSRAGPNNATGFHSLCEKSSAAASESNTRFIPRDVKAAMDGVPCPYEFFQYIQWHNLAVEEAEFRGLERLVVYYEDFGHNQDEIVNSVADFLGVSKSSKKRDEVPKFLRARMYDSYYTDEQKRAIWRLVETMALPKTLELLKRYRSG